MRPAAFVCLFSVATCLPAAAQGLLVTRAADGLRFTPAWDLEVNGKDRVDILGDKPATATPFNKLQHVKLGATLLRDTGSGVWLHYGPAPQYLYPQGISKKPFPAPPDAWKESALTYKKAEKDKTPTPVPMSEFVAYLAGGVKELAAVCMDESALALVGGGAQGVFPAQIELTAAAVAAHGTNPAMASVERRVAEFLRTRQERFDAGMDSARSLAEGLKMSELSAKAYADLPEHKDARAKLAASKAWLDQRMAILRTLAAGRQWDAFLLAYRPFEKHQGSFPELAKQQRAAMQASLDEHWKSGRARTDRGEFRRAWNELRLASLRKPSQADLSSDVARAWANYSRQSAVDRQNRRKQLPPGDLDVIEQNRNMADRYRQQNKLDEAMEKIAVAERIDAESLPLLLTKAGVLGARGETARALRTLDNYDLLAIEREREAGNKLRGELAFQLDDLRKGMRDRLAKAWEAGRYHETAGLAKKGLLADENDPVFLYYGGLGALVTHDRKTGLARLGKYLEVSDTLDANAEQRARVSRWLGLASTAPAANLTAVDAAGGHWLSGAPTPGGAAYCPVSLGFAARVDRIEASNKLSTKFNWDGPRLRSIVPVFEKAQASTGEKTISFSYAERIPHPFAVDAADVPRKAPEEADSLLAASNVILPNHPLIDAAMLSRLTGRQATVGVAGNRFFHPFVWERPYYFAFEYDERGRVKSARQLADKEPGARPPVLAEFKWNEMRLQAVRVYQLTTPDSPRGAQIYERTMQYQQDRLVGEEFRAGQKDGKIKYVWNGATLVSAECDKDESLDSRSREVFFATGAAGARGKR
ncbi:MAG: hypothetical protein IT162_13920 [Bryobacterales bacterium]|nr:hypothetical protein [Bryobacterales bacterium]